MIVQRGGLEPELKDRVISVNSTNKAGLRLQSPACISQRGYGIRVKY